MTSTAPEARQGQDAGEPHGEESASWQRRLRRFGHVPRPEIGLRERLVPPYTRPGAQLWAVLGVSPRLADRLVRWSAWGGPLLVALVAGVLRFWNLGSPHALIFDETYYAKDSWALIHQGYEGNWPKDVDKLILA
ncbi:phospholipid carrier-dependent glycosyltransferase, partial [Streptomyces sp. NPDC001274]